MKSNLLMISMVLANFSVNSIFAEETLQMNLQSQVQAKLNDDEFIKLTRNEEWNPAETAIIVCDVWDYHHCLNAVKRLDEFAPRLNQVLAAAREQGVTIIHSPSDCMPAYQKHPARLRAIKAPQADYQPSEIKAWCSVIPSEERAVYPIDQSDGGEDDDPKEHARWAEHLKRLGRNPGMPWQRQSDHIEIDDAKDFLSDRGDEVWNILEERGIKNVILTGVHVNMCVIGRPFGLRQMARNGKNVVLMRDMTDAMYNPKRWPYVSHHEGTQRIISHIEKYVCPTVTSDQILGGEAFQFADLNTNNTPATENKNDYWKLIQIPNQQDYGAQDNEDVWLRCVVRIPLKLEYHTLELDVNSANDTVRAWMNGQEMPLASRSKDGHTIRFRLPAAALNDGEENLIVINQRVKQADRQGFRTAPVLLSNSRNLNLAGRWQMQISDDQSLANMPLPAKFGTSTDIVYAPPEELWTPRALTRINEFTPGIEGPACDGDGNIYAVNYQEQGTIGRIRPDGAGEVFVKLPEGSIGNGIRFGSQHQFFVADYTGHNILSVDLKSKKTTVFAHEAKMNQPNDLAIAPDGTLYASDPNWSEGTGQLWKITPSGKVTLLAKEMGTTNGIEVSPNGKILYVNESKQLNVWAFDIAADGSISNKRLLRKFEDHGFDGMRCDVDGNLYVTRYGKGTVVKLSPQGEVLREIPVLGAKPSNICFGGPDGCTAYVTEVEFQRLVEFRVDLPGRSWQRK
ncbi:isochorismatase family protein [Planctomicrobium sp.]|nr:isochorismatase family protein [Planctomicrobium sp.]MDB4743316.1 isochorismatase family protein [Planctomicrobium sp.]